MLENEHDVMSFVEEPPDGRTSGLHYIRSSVTLDVCTGPLNSVSAHTHRRDQANILIVRDRSHW
jgi:hypothetical protein